MKQTLLVGYANGRIANRRRSCHVEVNVEIVDRNGKGLELSISCAVWNRSGSDIVMGGQGLGDLADYVQDWTMLRAQFDRIVEVWREWHLNGMRAGCKHQRAAGWRVCPGHYSAQAREEWDESGMPIYRHKGLRVSYPNCDGKEENFWTSHWYMVDRESSRYKSTPRCSLDGVGKPCPECGYKYGTQWLHDELPQAVIDEVRSWMSPEFAAGV